MAEDHICEDNRLPTNFRCNYCGEVEDFCTFCGENLHKCLPSLEDLSEKLEPVKGYRPIPGYPEYVMNSQGTIRSVAKKHYVFFVRLTSNGDALIMIYRDGIKQYKTVQELFALTFNRERNANEGL